MEVVVHSCAAAHKSVYCVETRKFFVASHCSCSLVITFLRYSISSSNCVRTARSRCSLILSGEAVFNFASYAMRSMHRCAQFARNSCSAPSYLHKSLVCSAAGLTRWSRAPLVSRAPGLTRAGLARRWSQPLVSRRWSHARTASSRSSRGGGARRGHLASKEEGRSTPRSKQRRRTGT